MSDKFDVDPEEQDSGEIESPVEGPPPDWMRTATSASSFKEEDAPAWLKNIRAGKGAEREAAESETVSESESAAGSDDTLSDLERLLAEEGIDLDSVSDERPEGSEGMSVRDWMIATSDDEMIRKQVGAEPLPEESVPTPPPEPAEPEPVPEPVATAVGELSQEDEELPDWLREVSEEEEPAPAPTPIPEPVVAEDNVPVEDEELPDWLSEVSDEEEPAPTPAPMPETQTVEDYVPVEDEELPDWLREVSSDEEEPTPTPAPMPEPAVAEDNVPVEDETLPDWLRETSEEAEETPPAPVEAPEIEPVVTIGADTEEEEALPDWLREVSDEEEEQAPPAEIPEPVAAIKDVEDEVMPPAEEDLPDWLREVSDEPPVSTGEPVAPPLSKVPDSGLETVADEDMPDWLQEVSEESLSESVVSATTDDKLLAGEELPEWLREVEEESIEDETFIPQLEAAPDSYDLIDSSETIDEENLPDWLADTHELDEASLPEPVAEDFRARVQADLAEDQEDLPDWLQEVQEEEAAEIPQPMAGSRITPEPIAELSTPSPGDEEIGEEELPDWLKEVQEETEPELEKIGLEPIAETADESEAIDEEELPDWLQEIDQGEVEPFEPSEPSPEEPFTEVTPEEDLAEEELPDWLREVEEEEEPEVPFAEMPAVKPPEQVVEPAKVEEEIAERALPDWLQGVEEEIEEEEIALPAPEPVAAYEPELAPAVIAEVEEVVETAEEPKEEAVPVSPEAVREREATPTAPPARFGAMPDWLKKLREGDLEEEEAPVVSAEPLPRPVVAQADAAVSPPVTQIEAKAESAAPEDADERLRLARSARDAGEIDKAVQFYDSLVSSGAYLERVIEDIRQTIKSYPSNSMLFQIMGDAMMKDGRLQSALDAYRTALSKL